MRKKPLAGMARKSTMKQNGSGQRQKLSFRHNKFEVPIQKSSVDFEKAVGGIGYTLRLLRR